MEQQESIPSASNEEFFTQANSIVEQIREATSRAEAIREAMVTAGSNLGLNMLTANEELVQAHRQLCTVLNTAEIRQRSALARLEKNARKTLYEIMLPSVLLVALSAAIGAGLGSSLTAFYLH